MSIYRKVAAPPLVGLAAVGAIGLATAARAHSALPTGAGAQDGRTTIVSVSSTESQTKRASNNPSMSSNGRYVAFGSGASQLVPGDTNSVRDVFVRDRLTGRTHRVSVGAHGRQANQPSWAPVISAGGRFVAFVSSADNLGPTSDTNRSADVFVRDRRTGLTQPVSVGRGGAQGDGASQSPAISADGRYIAFASRATNLIADDTSPRWDVYLKDMDTGTLRLVSVAGGRINAVSQSPSISANGRRVAFQSGRAHVGGVDNDIRVLVRDVPTGNTYTVSVGADGEPANHDSRNPDISADGTVVAFQSYATNLVPNDDPVAERDVYLRDLQAGITELVSVRRDGNSAGDSRTPATTAHGRYVAFVSAAANMDAAPTAGHWNVFVYDRATGDVQRRSGTDSSDSFHPAISGHGRHVAYDSDGPKVPADDDGRDDVFLHTLG